MCRRFCLPILLPALFLLLALYGCSAQNTALSTEEAQALALIAGTQPEDFNDISSEALTKKRAEKFPAVSKAACTESGLYGFICRPIAYNGPITLAVVIDGKNGTSLGMQILKHEETEHYVRDMENSWFTERFAGKSVKQYLRPARLEARNEWDIVAITGATVTTEGIINGVNAAFGLYREYVLEEDAPPVPYMVRFEPGEGSDPEENGYLAIRAYGVVLGEISLEQIRELPSVKRVVSIHTSSGVTQHSFRGVLLAEALALFDPALLQQYQSLCAVGADGYTSVIAMEEVLKENSVYLMYEDNGEPLPKQNGEPGAMRIIILEDTFGERFTNYLLEITLENEDML